MTQAQTAGYIFEERRGATRSTVSINAQGIIPNSDKAIDCTVLDISETGARIELNGSETLPRKFNLFVPETHTLFECLAFRRTGKQVGLVFENRVELKVV